MTMKGLVLRLAITTTVGSLLSSNPTTAQIPPPAKRAERVEIKKAPEVELSKRHLTIIRWTTNNPGGSDVHYGVVHYGTDRKELSQTAKNPITLNQSHPETTVGTKESASSRAMRSRTTRSRSTGGAPSSYTRQFSHIPSGEGPVTGTASDRIRAISPRSCWESERSAAGSVPSSCDARRAPTIATCTAGWEVVQATASCGSVRPRPAAYFFRRSITCRFCRSDFPVKSELWLRQSSAGNFG